MGHADKKKKILHSFVQERKENCIFESALRDENQIIMNDTADEEHVGRRQQQQQQKEEDEEEEEWTTVVQNAKRKKNKPPLSKGGGKKSNEFESMNDTIDSNNASAQNSRRNSFNVEERQQHKKKFNNNNNNAKGGGGGGNRGGIKSVNSWDALLKQRDEDSDEEEEEAFEDAKEKLNAKEDGADRKRGGRQQGVGYLMLPYGGETGVWGQPGLAQPRGHFGRLAGCRVGCTGVSERRERRACQVVVCEHVGAFSGLCRRNSARLGSGQSPGAQLEQ